MAYAAYLAGEEEVTGFEVPVHPVERPHFLEPCHHTSQHSSKVRMSHSSKVRMSAVKTVVTLVRQRQ